MTVAQAIQDGFRKALTFSGRSRRPEYWLFFAFVFGGAGVLGALELAIGGTTGGVLLRAFQIIVFLPFLAVGWRRLQDTGRPGWFLLVPAAIVVASTFVSGSVFQQMISLVLSPFGLAVRGGPGGLVGVMSLVQVLAGLVIVFWMSRPSQRGPNAYGPEPRVH
ncbi:DUF805 domain-containing protein [Roseinatronobacter alkalisoli]|uniref:DUF805 domain-containing protein n=1 Tax=Roseinatronobacter alkalisoli TaxID=3028235 RepID=A0ABT5T987_9RHOB|nr:DUF805 domain-containing protein [Roseinatronobacter sp. HJB301]MDD7971685.1 DUF805 domain-containing protein [Roseinatronobacter sp. HJB301]